LKEKEVLLQEIHHRVKNNMTVIFSLLKLQADRVNDEQYREMLSDSMRRIETMALIHEKLYRSEDLAEINFSDYIKDMVDSMYMSYGIGSHKVTLKKDVGRVALGIDDAIPCGLIVNELVSNSIKHAFPESREGKIKVAIRMNDKDEVELTISDNGIGMPEGLDFRTTDSLGLSLVNALVKQLQGEIELNKEKGTEFRITFKGPN
jgi:two-component sensor histidine kinase